MPKKPPKPNKDKRIKAIARERVGSPKPARVIPALAERIKLKHKKSLAVDDEDR